MMSPRLTVCIILSLIFMLSTVYSRKGVGLAGPDQVFSLEGGQNISSYIRVYNTGDENSEYLMTIDGNASQLVKPEANEITLAPDQNVKVPLLYMVPLDQRPGLYLGSVLISIVGEQISPGVIKDIAIQVNPTIPNRKPAVKIITPASGRVSGLINVTIEISDEDYDELNISIFLDGEWFGNTTNAELNTAELSNGVHSIRVSVHDGEDEESAEVEFRVDNPWYFKPEVVIVLLVSTFTFFLILAVVLGRPKER